MWYCISTIGPIYTLLILNCSSTPPTTFTMQCVVSTSSSYNTNTFTTTITCTSSYAYNMVLAGAQNVKVYYFMYRSITPFLCLYILIIVWSLALARCIFYNSIASCVLIRTSLQYNTWRVLRSVHGPNAYLVYFSY